MKIFSINTELFKLDGGAMFGVVPKSIWQKHCPADDNNLCTLAMRCMLVEDGNRLFLIDTGIGNKQDEKFFNYYFLDKENTLENSINNLGYSLNDVTDVIISHLHLDHCGGAVKKVNNQFKLTCPNATYWSNKTHWNWATVDVNPREKSSFLKENILPIKESGQLKFIEVGNNTRISDNIVIHFYYGHTNGLMVPFINYNGQQIIYVSDLIPCFGHIPIPYVPAYDINPLISMKEKDFFLKMAYENNSILFFEHETINECCNLQKTDKGIRIKDTFSLNSVV